MTWADQFTSISILTLAVLLPAKSEAQLGVAGSVSC